MNNFVNNYLYSHEFVCIQLRTFFFYFSEKIYFHLSNGTFLPKSLLLTEFARVRLLLVVHTAFSIFQKRCTIYLHLSNRTLLLRTLPEEERCQDIFLAREGNSKRGEGNLITRGI